MTTPSPTCATCTPCQYLMPNGKTVDLSWCPPAISTANTIHPSGSSFTWLDYALWGGMALIVVLVVVATVVLVLKKRAGSAKHSRQAGSPDPALPPESK
jgi:hypothetical protein